MRNSRIPQDTSNDRNYSMYSDSCSDAEKQTPPVKRKTKTEKLDDKMLKFLDSKLKHHEHRHVSFIKGVLPSLATFDDDEHLEFQAGVLALIQKIKKTRSGNLYSD